MTFSSFVPNASQGVVTAVQALVDNATSRNQRTHLVATSLGYGGVLFGLQHIAFRSNATYAVADLVYPHEVTAEIISSRIRALLPNSGEPIVVVLDHITSETGVLLPVDEIIAAIRATHPHAKFVIDAAFCFANGSRFVFHDPDAKVFGCRCNQTTVL